MSPKVTKRGMMYFCLKYADNRNAMLEDVKDELIEWLELNRPGSLSEKEEVDTGDPYRSCEEEDEEDEDDYSTD